MRTEQEVRERITELQTEINSMLSMVINAMKARFSLKENSESVAKDVAMASIANAQTTIKTNQKGIETLLWVLNPDT